MVLIGMAFLLAACGGSDNAAPLPPPPPTPVITAQPADMSVVAGSDASFSVTATGDSPAYQWQTSTDNGASWADIPGATATGYTLTGVAMGDSGHLFRVLVTAAGTTVSSSPARLTVTAAPVAPAITVQPADQTVTEPATATFNVTATGTALQYQWQQSADSGANWTDIGGATSFSYTTPATQAAASGVQLRVQVSNSVNSVVNNAATLAINAAPPPANGSPVFSTQPQNLTVAEGQVAHFSVVSSNATKYRWINSSDGVNWFYVMNYAPDDPGSATYDVTATMGMNGFKYFVRTYNSHGSTDSAIVTLTVTTTPPSLPVFTTQPGDSSVTLGQTTSFSAAASGWPTPTYQWQVSNNNGGTWGNIIGATADFYTQPGNLNTCNASGQRFRVLASNSEGTVYSNAAILTVNPPATGWQCDMQLGVGRETDVKVASNVSGQVAVVWPGSVSGDTGLYIRRYSPANGWGAAEGVALPGNNAGANMAIGMDNQGTVTMVWTGNNPALYFPQHLYAIRHVAASGWGAAVMQPLPDYTADGPGNGIPFEPRLAINPAGGDATVLWTQDQLPGSNRGKRNLLSATFGVGGWGNLQVIYEQNTAGSVTYAPGDMRVAVGPSGHAVAVWERYADDYSFSLWALHFTAGSLPSSPVQMTNTTHSTNFYTSGLAVDGSGHAIFAWEDEDSSVSRLRGRVLHYGSGWETPQWMSATGNIVVRAPHVAFAPDGSTALVSASAYDSNVSVNSSVVALPWTSAGGFGALQTVYDTGSYVGVQVSGVLANDGSAMIAAVDGSSQVKTSRRNAGTWSAVEIASRTSSAQTLGALTFLPNGNLLAAWGMGHPYPSDDDVWANIYKPAP
jgi:hypothetical protein